MKIAFYEIENWEIDYLKKALKKHKLVFNKNKINLKNAVKDADVLAVFIYSKVEKAILDSMPKLKLVTTMSTGFDHINLKECRKRGVKVCNVPTYGENTVAEHTFALILNISHRLSLIRISS